MGVYIHGLKNNEGRQSSKGINPFDFVFTKYGEPLSKHVKCYNPVGFTSTDVYNAIRDNLTFYIENAITSRNTY